MDAPSAPPPSFARTFVLPALWVLLLPALGLGFAGFQLRRWSNEVKASVRAEQAATPTMPAAQLEEELARFDLGEIAWNSCGPFGFFEAPSGLGDGFCGQMLQFEWVVRLGAGLLLLAVLLFLALALTVAWASRAPQSQHRAFRLGWALLRGFSIPHLLGQGLILLFLSFWMTALLLNVYVMKLIVAAGILALLGAAAALKALFARNEHVTSEHGLVLAPADAPAFFSRMQALAEKVGTAAPKNVVVGIDDNFFVTEVPLKIADRIPTPNNPSVQLTHLEGRTLYASLSLMRSLERPETEAVLVHELAHFAQGDTLRSQQMNPLLRRFEAYLVTLSHAFTFGVGACLVAFFALFERIMKRRSREAELSADAAAARVVGAEPAARALLKVGAYARYRARTENQLLESMTQEELRLAERVVRGFSAFVAEPAGRVELLSGLLQTGTPHPFDTHPPLEERLRNLGVPPPSSDQLEVLAERPAETACDDIPAVAELEQKLWTAYEERFQADHEFLIALRLVPKNADDIARIERAFPAEEHPSKRGPVKLSWRALTLADGAEVPYEDIALVSTRDLFVGGKALVLDLKSGPRQELKLRDFPQDGQVFLGAFLRFFQRHEISSRQAASPPASSPPPPA